MRLGPRMSWSGGGAAARARDDVIGKLREVLLEDDGGGWGFQWRRRGGGWRKGGGDRQPGLQGTWGQAWKGRGPQWSCPRCLVKNDLSRTACRACALAQPTAVRTESASAAPGSNPQQSQRLAAGSPTGGCEPKGAGQSSVPSAAAKVTALGQALAAAKSGGASQDAIAALDREMAEAKRAAAEGKPLGARLDSARARVARAKRAVAGAADAVAKAQARHAEAATQLAKARADLTALEAEVPSAAVPASPLLGVLAGARELLERLEGSRVVDPMTRMPPEPVLEAMRLLHAAVAAADPIGDAVTEVDVESGRATPHPDVEEQDDDAVMGASLKRGAPAGGAHTPPSAVQSSTELLVELDGAIGLASDAELAARVREIVGSARVVRRRVDAEHESSSRA